MTRKKILLADDADLILNLERAFLRRKNFHLLVARDARQVLQILERETPDLIFLDLALPGMAGDECCRRIKGDPRLQEIPVVVLADGGAEDVRRCREAGCDQILARPIVRQHLSILVRRLLDLPSRQVPRYEASLYIAYGSDRGNLFTGETLNLSTGGVLIETHHLLPVETRVFMELFLPGAADPLRCSGRVAWLNHPVWIQGAKRPGEMGVEFIDLSPGHKDLLQAHLQSGSEPPE